MPVTIQFSLSFLTFFKSGSNVPCLGYNYGLLVIDTHSQIHTCMPQNEVLYSSDDVDPVEVYDFTPSVGKAFGNLPTHRCPQ